MVIDLNLDTTHFLVAVRMDKVGSFFGFTHASPMHLNTDPLF
jgi:hypothetical protein